MPIYYDPLPKRKKRRKNTYYRHGELYFKSMTPAGYERFFGRHIRDPGHPLHYKWLRAKRLEARRRKYRKKRKSSPRHIHF